MQKSYLSFYFDFLFYTALIFFITFIWIRSFIHSSILIWSYSIIITLILSIILSVFLKKKIYKFKLSKNEFKEKNKILNQLIFSKKEEINAYISKFFNNKHIYKEYFTFTNNENYIVFNEFNFEGLNCNTMLSFIKKAEKEKCNKIYIFCNNYNSDCAKIAKNLKNIKIKLINFDNFYVNYIKKQNLIPNFEDKYEEKTSYKFKELLSIAFNKTKTKNYVFTGLIFLTGSIFMRYNIYYLIFTSLMFIFALFSYFNKIYNKTPEEF